MFYQLFIGSIVICITIVIQSGFVMAATAVLPRLGGWLDQGRRFLKSTLIIIVVVLWLLVAHSIGIWLWALNYLWHGAFDSLEPALYFSIVSFTTLGFGDIILPVETRLFSGMAASNGLIAFGLSTAFLVEFLIRLRKAHRIGEPS